MEKKFFWNFWDRPFGYTSVPLALRVLREKSTMNLYSQIDTAWIRHDLWLSTFILKLADMDVHDIVLFIPFPIPCTCLYYTNVTMICTALSWQVVCSRFVGCRFQVLITINHHGELDQLFLIILSHYSNLVSQGHNVAGSHEETEGATPNSVSVCTGLGWAGLG